MLEEPAFLKGCQYFVPREGFLAGSVSLYLMLLKPFRDTRGSRLVYLCQYLSSLELFICNLSMYVLADLYGICKPFPTWYLKARYNARYSQCLANFDLEIFYAILT